MTKLRIVVTSNKPSVHGMACMIRSSTVEG